MNEYVEFRKERDLGTIINDSFRFIRLEWRSFFKTVLKMAIIPIFIVVAAILYFFYSIETDAEITGAVISGLLAFIGYLLAFLFINLAGMGYVKSYIYNRGAVSQEDIMQTTKDKFWTFLVFTIFANIIIITSFFLFVFPVFYTATALMLGISIVIFEDEGAFSSIGRSFSMIRNYFWETLGALIAITGLLSVLSFVFQIPVTIYQVVKGFVEINTSSKSSLVGIYGDPIYLILTGLSYVGNFLFYSVTLVAYSFIYFDINEQENGTGALELIETLGQD